MTESMPSVSKLADLPDEEAALRTSKALYRAALGPVNAGHYLALFERFDASGRAGLVWNSAAGFFTPVWLVFRRLWAWAAAYLALVAALLLLGRGMSAQLASWPTGVVMGLLVSLGLLLVVVPGLAGNAILHAHTRQRVARARAGAPSLGDACIVLAEDAPSWNSLKAVLLGGGVAAVGLVAAVVVTPGGQVPPGSGAPEKAVIEAATLPPAAGTPSTSVPAVPSPSTTVAEPKPAVPPVAPSPATAENATAPARPELPTAAPEAAVVPVAGPKPAAESMKKPPAKTVSAPAPKPREPAAKPSADKQKPRPSPATVAPSSWAINVGVFADAANAERVQAQLKAAKLAVYTQQIEGAKGTLTRVRVGPFADPEQAAAAAQRIRALGLDAVVFRP